MQTSVHSTNPKETIKLKKLKQMITLVALVAISAISLYACGGDTSTATPVKPTATVAVAAAPTNTTAAVAAPTDTTAAVAAPTDTTAPAAGEPTATTASTSGNGGGGGNSSDAMSLLQQSSTAMKGVKSYHLVLKVSTSGVKVSGDGDVALPDKMRINMTSSTGTTTNTAQLLIVGNDMYTQVPGSDAYYQTPGGGASMLSSTASTSRLSDIAENANIVGDETLDGVDTTHVKFTYSADKAVDAAAKAAGVANPTPSTGLGEANAEVWVEKATGYIHQFSSSSTVAGTASTTTVIFSKYNEDVNPPIVAPTNIQQLPGAPGAGTTPTP
jgi:outer membrane lipoprotein-sorting protein